ncbi:arginine/serine-rich coiled-coil protein 2-like [Pectinophora gossypiella]|uniref:arginine/serine-rich coiled-coil protein 2-like n=1 Tax=Pectinophora gossypiella TaxID=13191 RepID=UPI00214ED845|nr:arginine/serine-rich coiled-coil protein 2-like [Pectinophora gossypiella]
MDTSVVIEVCNLDTTGTTEGEENSRAHHRHRERSHSRGHSRERSRSNGGEVILVAVDGEDVSEKGRCRSRGRDRSRSRSHSRRSRGHSRGRSRCHSRRSRCYSRGNSKERCTKKFNEDIILVSLTDDQMIQSKHRCRDRLRSRDHSRSISRSSRSNSRGRSREISPNKCKEREGVFMLASYIHYYVPGSLRIHTDRKVEKAESYIEKTRRPLFPPGFRRWLPISEAPYPGYCRKPSSSDCEPALCNCVQLKQIWDQVINKNNLKSISYMFSRDATTPKIAPNIQLKSSIK